MSDLNMYEMKFTTGHSKDTRYFRIRASDAKGAETQLFRMYCSINTTLLSTKRIEE